jgi:N-acetylglucosaminyl-diphospho-decaprenol L-rhamnosyltransferase
MKKLSIIIVSYNTSDMTADCIRSTIQQTHSIDYEIVVYDNASKDGSADRIAAEFPQVRLIRGPQNLGFAMGNNEAIKTINSEYVLLLNPDTVVLDQAINKLMDFAEKTPDAGIWGGKTLFGNRTLNPGSCFRKMSIWNQFCRASGLAGIFKHSPVFHSEHYGGWLRDTVRHVDIVCGCFLLIKLDLWNSLGGFDKRFFMYAEEADLCLRAKAKGCNPIINPEAIIVHYGGGSEKVRADKMVRLISAKIELQKIHWPKHTLFIGIALFKLWVINRVVIFSTLSRLKVGNINSNQDNLKAWRDVWSRRQEWINGYTRSDNG